MANLYRYLARDKKGKQSTGEIEANTIALAKFMLRKQGLWTININHVKGKKAKDKAATAHKLRKGKITLKDMVIFSRQFASMVEAGIAMLRVLTVLVDQTENEKLRNIIIEIKVDVEQGTPLSVAIGKYPETFDRLFIAMIKAGEAGGVLDQVLNRLAFFLEARANLNHKINTAMAYPITIVIISVVVVSFMLTVILPQFTGLFAQTGAELPGLTQFLINISDLLLNLFNFINKPFETIALDAVIIGAVWSITNTYNKWSKTEAGRRVLDSLKLKIPILGTLNQKVAVARFTRTFGTLIESGVPIITALDVVKDAADNALLEEVIEEVKKEAEEGGELSTQLAKSTIFPPMVTQMISIGEESGELETMLDKIADFYDTEVDNAVESLTAIMEPLFIVILGGIVGTIVVAMYLPIFDVIKHIQ